MDQEQIVSFVLNYLYAHQVISVLFSFIPTHTVLFLLIVSLVLFSQFCSSCFCSCTYNKASWKAPIQFSRNKQNQMRGFGLQDLLKVSCCLWMKTCLLLSLLSF